MKRWEEESKWSWLMTESETFVGTTLLQKDGHEGQNKAIAAKKEHKVK